MFSETPVLSDSCGSRRDCRIHACIQDYEKWREGAYAQDKLNIRANAPSPLLSKLVCKKGGAYFWELMVLHNTYVHKMLFVFFL